MPADSPCLAATIAGEPVVFDADHALVWHRQLFVADTHFGKDALGRARDAAIPEGTTDSDLARLDQLIERHTAEQLTILGDVFHSEHAAEPRTLARLKIWRTTHAELPIRMVAGNHDRRALHLAEEIGIERLDDGFALGPWRLCHEPSDLPGGHVLCGHVHPGVRLRGTGRESLRLPVFFSSPGCTILPAFGAMTGLHILRPRPLDQVFAVAGDRIFDLRRSSHT